MADRFGSRAAVRGKVDREGSIMAAVDYGIKAADMPEGDTELAEAWAALEVAYAQADLLAGHVEALLPACADDDDQDPERN